MLSLDSLVSLEYCYNTLTQIPIYVLLYSHIPSALVALFFCFLVLYKNKSLSSSALLVVTLLFTLWSFLDLNAWFSFMGAENTMFAWSMIDLVGLLFFFFSYRFLYIFIKENEIPRSHAFISLIIILPTFLTTLFGLNLTGFDAVYCEAIENSTITQFTYFAQALFILSVFLLGVTSYRKSNIAEQRSKILLSTTGVLLFLLFFFTATYVVTFLNNHTEIANPYNYEIYGLFGMPILLIFLGYLIVRYHAFNIKLIGAQVLILGLVSLIGSLFFLETTTTGIIIVGATFILSIIGGFFLVRSVKKEVKQREEIERLAVNLKRANEQLKALDKMKSEFVSIASHQLRSPLTSIRGHASMLSEGTYGKFPVKAQAIVDKISESAKFMALSIEDYLNVSRIEAGNMKYEMTDFNVKEMAEKLVDELRPVALKKGLLMLFSSDCDGSCSVHADIGKTRQVLMNLIDNAMKYTPKGTITVVAHDDVKRKKMFVTIKDTGVGINADTIDELFDKFVRAKNANCVNVTGTGLGLYVAKKMIDGMNGRVWAESEGEGKGSSFHIELPLLPGNPSVR